MDFVTAFNSTPYLVYDGPMETRIEYDTDLKMDEAVSLFTLVFDEKGRKILEKFYREDISVAKNYDMPIIINAPTFRANLAHSTRLGYDIKDLPKINLACIEFTKEIRSSYGDFKKHIFVTAPIGPRLVGYKPDYATDLNYMTNFYAQQADAAAESQVDIISITAMPSLIEAMGSARATANTSVPYSVGLIMTPEGRLLDGTPIEETIERIDCSTKVIPNFYVISCTHPRIAAQALMKVNKNISRIKGIKANGCPKTPEQLLQLDHAEADDPDVFAREVVQLGRKYQLKVYGGCCGTDSRHLEAIIKELQKI